MMCKSPLTPALTLIQLSSVRNTKSTAAHSHSAANRWKAFC